MRRWLRPTLVLFCLAASGCATTVVPPSNPADRVTVYLTDYGRHSSLLLPDPRGHLSEFAYGDWDWFAQRHTDSGSGLRALFASKYSTIGRRQLSVDDRENVEAIARAIKAAHVAKIEVARDRAEALLERIDRFYERRLDTVTYSPFSQMWFVRYAGRYGLLHNCNHATAGWLRELGCDVRGSAMFSKFTVRAIKTSDPTTPSTAPVASREKLGKRLTYGPVGG